MTKRIKVFTAFTLIIDVLSIGLYLGRTVYLLSIVDFYFLIMGIGFFSSLLNIIIIIRNIVRKKRVKISTILLSLGFVGLLVLLILIILMIIQVEFFSFVRLPNIPIIPSTK